VDAGSHAGPRTVFRLPVGPRLFGAFAVLVCGVVAAFLTAAAILVIWQRAWAAGLALAATACFVAGLTGYAARDLRGKWGLRVVLGMRALTLDLPAGRSLIHRPAAEHAEIAYSDIAALETRLEGYRTGGMAMMQRAYVLRHRNGALIFLFEDRAIGTPFETRLFARIAGEIAARAGTTLRDLGTVAGDGGVLGVWGTHAPAWGAPSLSAAQQARLWRAVAITGALPLPIILIALLLRLWTA